MNPRRVAALHRKLAEIHGELAEAYDEDPANDATKRRPRRLPPLPAQPPVQPPSELDRKRAEQDLRRLGYRVRP